jgi:hypothetical protein
MSDQTLIKPKDPKTAIKSKVKFIIDEEKQVIVHCSIPCSPGDGVRIWRTTYLITDEKIKIPLIYWEGITLAPNWTPLYHKGNYQFTLIFGGLPKGCKSFSLVEEIVQAGGFLVRGIKRNGVDVYRVTV